MIKNSRSYFYLIKDFKSICEVESQVIAHKICSLKNQKPHLKAMHRLNINLSLICKIR